MTNPCPRCLIGVDDDDDGNCALCARLTDSQLLPVIRALTIADRAWIERAKQYLGAAYDNDVLHFTEGADFLKGPQ